MSMPVSATTMPVSATAMPAVSAASMPPAPAASAASGGVARNGAGKGQTQNRENHEEPSAHGQSAPNAASVSPEGPARCTANGP